MVGRLNPARFFAASRSAIVNLDRVREIQSLARGSHIVILDNGTQVTLSGTRREVLARLLDQGVEFPR